jgi:hypothetical protein
MDLRPKGVAMAPKANLLLSTLCQIGDVVLVHNEDALDLPPLTERQGCIRLIGCDVQAHDGTCLGKAREPLSLCHIQVTCGASHLGSSQVLRRVKLFSAVCPCSRAGCEFVLID